MASRLYEILRKDFLSDIETGPWFLCTSDTVLGRNLSVIPHIHASPWWIVRFLSYFVAINSWTNVNHISLKDTSFIQHITNWNQHQENNDKGSHVNCGADSISKCRITSTGNPIVETRRSYDRLISTMDFPILVRQHLDTESAPGRHKNCRKLSGLL